MTVSEWHVVGSRRSELAKLLASEVMKEALQTLKDNEIPLLVAPAPGTKAEDVIAFNGIQHIRRSAFHEALAALQALTVEPPEPKKKITRRALLPEKTEP